METLTVTYTATVKVELEVLLDTQGEPLRDYYVYVNERFIGIIGPSVVDIKMWDYTVSSVTSKPFKTRETALRSMVRKALTSEK